MNQYRIIMRLVGAMDFGIQELSDILFIYFSNCFANCTSL